MKQFILVALAGLIAAQASTQKPAEPPKDMPEEETLVTVEGAMEAPGADLETEGSPDLTQGEDLKIAIADFSKLFEKGACPDVKGKTDIDYAKIAGEWYL